MQVSVGQLSVVLQFDADIIVQEAVVVLVAGGEHQRVDVLKLAAADRIYRAAFGAPNYIVDLLDFVRKIFEIFLQLVKQVDLLRVVDQLQRDVQAGRSGAQQ